MGANHREQNMLDELTDKASLRETHQEELIARYCSGVFEHIHMAASQNEAMRIVDDACDKFDRQCESRIVQRFLRQHVRRILDYHWGEKV
jgi:hypothetical protein